MKILVVSDTHGNDDILKELYNEYPKMDLYLHAGDSQSSSMAIYPFDAVEGNCDYFDFDRCRKVYTPKGYLFMKHYPNLTSKEKEDIKFFIHGHTHRNALYEEDNVVVICPGSLSLPRDGTLGTYAIMEINEGESNIYIVERETKNILKRMKLM